MKAFLITHKSFPDLPGTVIAAPSAGRAKSWLAGELDEFWGFDFHKAVTGMSCRRIHEFDEKAEKATFVRVIGSGGQKSCQ